jgi:dTDP-4-dehydrorhamnose 3,5-epimerase
MELIGTDFDGLFVIKPDVHNDDRGYFYESWQDERYKKMGISNKFVQDNEAKSVYGVIRGLHYQLKPKAQAKLVRVIQGEILDVVLDIRPDSKTFGQYFEIILSEANKFQLLIPKGFAHGYACLTPEVIFSYKCDEIYAPELEGHIALDDPNLKIDWRIPASDRIISAKDNHAPVFGEHIPF